MKFLKKLTKHLKIRQISEIEFFMNWNPLTLSEDGKLWKTTNKLLYKTETTSTEFDFFYRTYTSEYGVTEIIF